MRKLSRLNIFPTSQITFPAASIGFLGEFLLSLFRQFCKWMVNYVCKVIVQLGGPLIYMLSFHLSANFISVFVSVRSCGSLLILFLHMHVAFYSLIACWYSSSNHLFFLLRDPSSLRLLVDSTSYECYRDSGVDSAPARIVHLMPWHFSIPFLLGIDQCGTR